MTQEIRARRFVLEDDAHEPFAILERQDDGEVTLSLFDGPALSVLIAAGNMAMGRLPRIVAFTPNRRSISDIIKIMAD